MNGALAEAKSNRASPAANIKQGGLGVKACKLLNHFKHLLENRLVNLEKGKGRHAETEPAENFLIVERAMK